MSDQPEPTVPSREIPPELATVSRKPLGVVVEKPTVSERGAVLHLTRPLWAMAIGISCLIGLATLSLWGFGLASPPLPEPPEEKALAAALCGLACTLMLLGFLLWRTAIEVDSDAGEVRIRRGFIGSAPRHIHVDELAAIQLLSFITGGSKTRQPMFEVLLVLRGGERLAITHDIGDEDYHLGLAKTLAERLGLPLLDHRDHGSGSSAGSGAAGLFNRT